MSLSKTSPHCDANVGIRIRETRKKRKMTLVQVADGVLAHQNLSKIERGIHRPSPPVLARIAQKLDTPVEYLAWGPKPPSGYQDRAVWITQMFGGATNNELRKLLKENPPSSGRHRMIWLQQKMLTFGPQRLVSLYTQLEKMRE